VEIHWNLHCDSEVASSLYAEESLNSARFNSIFSTLENETTGKEKNYMIFIVII
jgi:hypothetical protein